MYATEELYEARSWGAKKAAGRPYFVYRVQFDALGMRGEFLYGPRARVLERVERHPAK